MNTVELGDAFENRSFDAIRIGIKEGLLGIPYDDARPFQKKGYFSKKRGKDITIDLSVELWPPNATRPSILYLIECKDHAADISVGKIEEFAGKVSQIADGGFFVKGVFISGTSFQSGALEAGKNFGFMMIELDKLNNLSIKFHKRDKTTRQNVPHADTEQKIEQFFQRIFSPKDASPVLSKINIAKKANEILNDFDPGILKHGTKLSIDKLLDYFTEKHDLNFNINMMFPDNESHLLGYYDLPSNEIRVNSSLDEMPYRKAFVIAHEIGHFVLHKELRVSQEYYDSFSEPDYSFSSDRYVLNNFKNWVEWQANYFAACLLMPKDIFLAHHIRYQIREGISKYGRIYLDHQTVNRRDYQNILNYLCDQFNCSKTSIIYRLEEYGVIKYAFSGAGWQNNVRSLFLNPERQLDFYSQESDASPF